MLRVTAQEMEGVGLVQSKYARLSVRRAVRNVAWETH
jgi:hypothetical protein